MGSELKKDDLYEAVKMLVELESTGKSHFHFSQHKLFTLYSVAFQYLLYCSTKEPGAYIVRIEDGLLADKIAKRAKDPSSRRFLQSLLIPRKIKYGNSFFYLDFFHVSSWNLTNDIPQGKIRGAMVVKNTSERPFDEMASMLSEEDAQINALLPPNYFLETLLGVVPRVITVAYDWNYEGLTKVEFPFIKKEQKRTLSGVTLAKEFDWDSFED